MVNLALIGKDVSKSLSPRMHTFLLREMGESCRYELLSLSPDSFERKAESLFETYDAFNVTIPYKRAILPFLKDLSEESRKFGSVNTVLSAPRAGYNTDIGGFSLLLETEGISVAGKQVLVLGAGGAGRSCIGRLVSGGAQVSVYEEVETRLEEVFQEIGGFRPLSVIELEPYDLIVNCTGVGMHETVGQLPAVKTSEGKRPFPEELFRRCETAIDLIYEPKRSAFLTAAARQGKRIVNGEGMLFYQAYLADCIILNRPPCAEEAKRLWEKYTEETK